MSRGPRTQIHRLPEKARHDTSVRDAILDEGRVAHVAVITDGTPFVLPVAYARDGDRVLIHGSRASRLFRTLAAGGQTCLTVTLLDGLVLARSAFESSMLYRSVMILGTCTALEGDAHRRALDVLTDHLLPGRREHVRPTRPQEFAATMVLALPMAEWSMKVADDGPDDPPEDVALPIWAGTIPLRTVSGDPVAADDLPPGIPLPEHVRRLAH